MKTRHMNIGIPCEAALGAVCFCLATMPAFAQSDGASQDPPAASSGAAAPIPLPGSLPPGSPDPWMVKPPIALDLSVDDLPPQFPLAGPQDLAYPSIFGRGWPSLPYGASFKLYGFVDPGAAAATQGWSAAGAGGFYSPSALGDDWRSAATSLDWWRVAPPAFGALTADGYITAPSARTYAGFNRVQIPRTATPTAMSDLILPPLSIGPRVDVSSRLIPPLPGAGPGPAAPAPILGAERRTTPSIGAIDLDMPSRPGPSGNLAVGHVRAGDAALAAGLYRDAAAAYQKAILLGAGEAGTHLRRSQALFAAGAFDEAGAELLAGINRLPLGDLAGVKQFRVLHDDALVERRLQELQALLTAGTADAAKSNSASVAEADTGRLALAGFVAYTYDRRKTGLQYLQRARATAPDAAALAAFVFVLEQTAPPEPPITKSEE